VSADGKRAYGSAYNNYVYLSTDVSVLPTTWDSITGFMGTKQWKGVACSSDGNTAIAVATANTGDYVYKYTEGVGWGARQGSKLYYSSVACDENCTNILIGDENDLNWSRDGLTTIVNAGAPSGATYHSVSVSKDGTRMLAATFGSTYSPIIWTATSNAWVALASLVTGNWHAAAISGDALIVGLRDTGDLKTTLNDGSSYTTNFATSAKLWAGSCISADTGVSVAVALGALYVSQDSGLTWVERNTQYPTSWAGAACNADGNVLLAADSSGKMWVGDKLAI
jgi:DNA-binding beta-propeller fold protein YncE